MNAKEHKVAGICAGIITCMVIDKYGINQAVPNIDTIYKLGSYAGIVALASFGSRVPDIDQPNSTFGRKLGVISKALNKTFGHRGLLHYPSFVVLLCGLLYLTYNIIPQGGQYIFKICSIGFIAGYISHIILDMFNSEGIKLFGPFVGFQFKIPVGITTKRKNKFISWRYLKGDNTVDRCIANMISIGAIIISGLYIYGFLVF